MRLKTISLSVWCLGLAGMLLAGAPILVSQPVQAQTKQQVATARKAINAAYKAEDAAFVRANAKASMSSYAPSYIYATKDGGKYSRQGFEDHLTRLLKTARNINYRTTIERVTLNGNSASVRIKTHAKMRLMNSEGKLRDYTGSEQRVDTWTNQRGKWLRTHGKQISISHTVDGKRLG